jgi:acetyltransferase-like isoleucine patch superfamily enzyme
MRKILSALTLIKRALISHFNTYCVLVFSRHVIFGKKTSLGSGVSIRTYDGGKITIGDNVSIEQDVEIVAQGSTILIGDSVFIGRGCQIIAKQFISVGNDSQIASYCVIRDANHKMERNDLIRIQGYAVQPISIGEDVWIGSQSSIIMGAKINNGCVVGANSLINKELVGYGVYVGSPAKLLKFRS